MKKLKKHNSTCEECGAEGVEVYETEYPYTWICSDCLAKHLEEGD